MAHVGCLQRNLQFLLRRRVEERCQSSLQSARRACQIEVEAYLLPWLEARAPCQNHTHDHCLRLGESLVNRRYYPEVHTKKLVQILKHDLSASGPQSKNKRFDVSEVLNGITDLALDLRHDAE